MIGRKSMGRASPILLVLLALGFFFASYNLLTLVIHNKTSYSGLWGADQLIEPVIQRRENAKNSKYHVALTATDAPYSQWQCRIMYYWYKKVKDMPGSDMGKFTRVLHSGNADNLMEEIPTVVVDPLPEGLDRGYIVLNRPWAFVQWLEKATIEEEYILMAEPDHIFVNPLPNLAHGNSPAGYPFFYIKPAENEKIIRKFYPEEKGPVTDIDPIGNSPVIIKKFGAKICVITSFRDACYIEILPKDRNPTREVWLSFWSEVHYNSLYASADVPTRNPRKKHWLF